MSKFKSTPETSPADSTPPKRSRARLLDLGEKPGWTNGRHKALSRIDGELVYQKSEGGYDAEADRGVTREGARDYEKYPSLIAGKRVYRGEALGTKESA